VIDTLAARRDADGRVEIVFSVGTSVWQTTDEGATTEALVP
jgi:hypothetical protein